MELQTGDCLIVVDVQRDFCPGGTLGVRDGDKVVPVLNRWIADFRARGLPVVYTQDWHPADHCSFQEQGGSWPPHCVQGMPGAEFHPDLRVEGEIFRKAVHAGQEAYSGWQGHRVVGDEPAGGESLPEWLTKRGIRRVFVGGLATDYCVRATVLDALAAGLQAVLIRDGALPVDVEPGDGERAIKEMLAAGAEIA